MKTEPRNVCPTNAKLNISLGPRCNCKRKEKGVTYLQGAHEGAVLVFELRLVEPHDEAAVPAVLVPAGQLLHHAQRVLR